ncbi:MAG TPA: FAD:protein FMN transferase [Acidobacteriota bacterium]
MQGSKPLPLGRGASSESPVAYARGSEAPHRPTGHWLHAYRTAMACRFEVTLPAGASADLAAARQALDQIDRLEDQLTVYRDSSEVSLINRTAGRRPVAVKSNLFGLLELAQKIHDETEGAFDITAGPVIRCWGFLKRQGRVPSTEELETARSQVGMRHVILDGANQSVEFRRAAVEINLGSIGKGHALDRVAAGMRARAVRSALLSGGSSSLCAIGNGSGGGWHVGVRHPRARRSRLATIRLQDCALATSGSGEQYFLSEGKRYGHIIDPRSGMPAEGVAGVTVVAASAAVADALATAFFVGGRQLAERYCRDHPGVLVLMLEEGDLNPVIIGEISGCTIELDSRARA